MRPAKVTVRVPGKVNLHLAVGALEASGYHDVRNILQAVSIYDELVAGAPAEPGAITMTLTGEGAGELPLDDRNLVVQAARLLASHAGISDGIHLEVRKAIPVMAGMAGGSADGAGALVACDAFWGTGLPREHLLSLAGRLGSDVPFSLAGGTALGSGRGERLSPVLSAGTYWWTFAIADEGLSTRAVYGELDRYRAELPRPELISPAELLASLRRGDVSGVGHALANDLQTPAIRLRPTLADVLQAGRDLGAVGAVVSGSGPTCAFLGRDQEHASRLAEGMKNSGTCRTAFVAHGPVAGARVVESG